VSDEVEPASIAKHDWRLQAVTTLSKPYRSPAGDVSPVGTAVELITFISFLGQQLVASIASPPALLLSLAARLATSADPAIQALESLKLDTTHNARRAHQIGNGAFFSALEDLIGCTVFSVTALEAFANQTIPDGYNYETLRSDNRCTEVFNKEQLERHIPLDVKLDVILPAVCKVPSPKGTRLWQQYVTMRRLRDRVVHLKSSDMKPSEQSDQADYLWSLLLSQEVRQFPRYALQVMSHYYPAEKPRWLRKCPI
jgi:hypothetical protein